MSRKRLLYGLAIFLAAVCAALVIWQGSFNFGEFGPTDASQIITIWGLSTIIFMLTVILLFMLGRMALKLYIERQHNREGSRIRTKLVLGALALSFLPVLFMLVWSVEVLNRNLDKWFALPVTGFVNNLSQVDRTLRSALVDRAAAEAELLATMPETSLWMEGPHGPPDFLASFCEKRRVAGAAITAGYDRTPIASCGQYPIKDAKPDEVIEGSGLISYDGHMIGAAHVLTRVPLDVLAKQREISGYVGKFNDLYKRRRSVDPIYRLLLALITLFNLFVAYWLAQYLARQISTPIAALAKAAEEVSKGNLDYRVTTPAIDELAGLVRGFNQMTQDLAISSRELESRRRFTEAILESIPTGVISVTSTGVIQRVNRALKAILPAASVETAKRLDDLFSLDDTAEIRYLMNRARRTGMAAAQFEIAEGGHALHLSITVSALEDRSSSGFVIVVEDTSELLRAQKAAAWSEVARRVAHEIKNPLTPITLSAGRILRQLDRGRFNDATQEIIRECAQTIAGEAESVKNLVDEFSEFSRLPAPRPIPCDLNEVVDSALAVFAGRLEGIEVERSLDPGIPPVLIDPEQFKRVVVNLIDNAAEAMTDSPVRQLFVQTRTGAPDSVEIIVADTGCGVSEEDKEKLFLPYFSTKNRGTGLGLAIVNRILSDHGADVRVEDNAPAGTRFTVEIPAIVEVSEPLPA